VRWGCEGDLVEALSSVLPHVVETRSPGDASAYDPAMTQPVWPLFDLRLTTPDLELRPMTEADLSELVAVVPDDLEVDPALPKVAGLGAREQRAVGVAQVYWRALGRWSSDSWELVLVCRHNGRIVGSQCLEGEDFARLRTVDSWSWLASDARGRGWGKQMRRAALTLAFGPLGAENAVTSAWHDTAASLGVSRSLGYADNGVQRHKRDDGADTMVHLRMARDDWERSGLAEGVTVEGFEACRPFFGV
jgi:RimJ/RimL family protein N-acetyltransferase